MTTDKQSKDLKRKAENYLSKGNNKKALELFSQLRELVPSDMRVVQKMGDIYRKIGDLSEAKASYKLAADYYTKEGYWAKAVALHKVIINLDPFDRDVQKKISDIYTSQGLSGRNIILKTAEQRDKTKDAPGEPLSKDALAENRWRVPLFSQLGPEAMSDLIDKLAVRRIREGTLICKDGDHGQSMFVISEGWVEIFKERGSEKAFLSSLKEGDFFGEFGLLTDGKRHANAIAKSDVVLLEITKKNFDELTSSFPAISNILDEYFRTRTLDNVLKNSDIFESLYTEERLKVISKFGAEAYEKGSYIFKEGDPGNKLYFIKSGEADVSTSRDGDHLVIARLKTGDFFGEISLISGKPRTADVRATSGLELLSLDKKSFDSIIREYPSISAKLKAKMEERAKDTIEAYQSHSEMKKCLGMV